MSLCHDERDFALGFSRHNPSAHRHTSSSESERQKERKKYLKSLTPARKKAHERVNLCLAAVGQYFVAYGQITPINHGDLHTHFPAFAREMNWKGPFYRLKNGSCPAIDIAYPETPGSVWMITPYFEYDDLDEDERKHVHTKKARRAAFNFCKAWLPNWKWDQITLPLTSR